jgi:predicted AAA+ superfamily ATPase
LLTKYIEYLKEAYLIFSCNRYDLKGKKILESLEKYYSVDVGIRNSILNKTDENIPRILENIVYLELIRRGYDVNVGKFNIQEKNSEGKYMKKEIEIDFIAIKNDVKIYIQVTTTVLNSTETFLREIKPLTLIRDHFEKLVLTEDKNLSNTKEGIVFKNIKD